MYFYFVLFLFLLILFTDSYFNFLLYSIFHFFMFNLHKCTIFIQLKPVYINHVKAAHWMLLSSKYKFFNFVRISDYLKIMADTKTVYNWIISQLINNNFRLLRLLQSYPIRQGYTIKLQFPGRHFMFTNIFASSLSHKLQAVLRFQLSDGTLNYNVSMFSLQTTEPPHMHTAPNISHWTSRTYNPASHPHLHHITPPTLTHPRLFHYITITLISWTSL